MGCGCRSKNKPVQRIDVGDSSDFATITVNDEIVVQAEGSTITLEAGRVYLVPFQILRLLVHTYPLNWLNDYERQRFYATLV